MGLGMSVERGGNAGVEGSAASPPGAAAFHNPIPLRGQKAQILLTIYLLDERKRGRVPVICAGHAVFTRSHAPALGRRNRKRVPVRLGEWIRKT